MGCDVGRMKTTATTVSISEMIETIVVTAVSKLELAASVDSNISEISSELSVPMSDSETWTSNETDSVYDRRVRRVVLSSSAVTSKL